mmetsp:Transcript_23516/g.53047  ORF Transcript_23516/g.53047 Transcript_23516/m.53047 type:complete len:305 (+) Transcript_23516:201-1115(+)
MAASSSASFQRPSTPEASPGSSPPTPAGTPPPPPNSRCSEAILAACLSEAEPEAEPEAERGPQPRSDPPSPPRWSAESPSAPCPSAAARAAAERKSVRFRSFGVPSRAKKGASMWKGRPVSRPRQSAPQPSQPATGRSSTAASPFTELECWCVATRAATVTSGTSPRPLSCGSARAKSRNSEVSATPVLTSHVSTLRKRGPRSGRHKVLPGPNSPPRATAVATASEPEGLARIWASAIITVEGPATAATASACTALAAAAARPPFTWARRVATVALLGVSLAWTSSSRSHVSLGGVNCLKKPVR